MALNPHFELMVLDEQILLLEHEMMSKENVWIFLEPCEDKPGRAIRKLRPEFQAAHAALQERLVALLEKRTEIRRSLNLDLEEVHD